MTPRLLIPMLAAALAVTPASAEERKKATKGVSPMIGPVDQSKVKWRVAIDPDNPVMIRVTVSMKEYSILETATQVSFSVEFYDGRGKRIGEKTFEFLDGAQPFLSGGSLYARAVEHGLDPKLGAVRRVVGKNLTCRIVRDALVYKPEKPDPTKGVV